MNTRIVPKTQLRQRIRKELDELGEDNLLITDRGQPLAVCINVDRWNEMQEHIEDLEDRLAIAELDLSGEAERLVEEGRPIQELWAEIEAEERDAHGQADAGG